MVDKHNIEASVWRVVWETSVGKQSTAWSIHYNVVRELYDEKKDDMPAANVKMQSAEVESITNIENMNFDLEKEIQESPKQEFEERHGDTGRTVMHR